MYEFIIEAIHDIEFICVTPCTIMTSYQNSVEKKTYFYFKNFILKWWAYLAVQPSVNTILWITLYNHDLPLTQAGVNIQRMSVYANKFRCR